MPARSTVRTLGVTFAALALVAAALVVHLRQPGAAGPDGTGAATSATATATASPEAPSDRLTAPSWTLTDMNGRTVHSSDLDGKVRVVSFLFPYCTGYCPVAARAMVQLEDEVAGTPLAGRLRLVAFNVDPAGADRAAMRAFWRQFGGDPGDPHVSYLTGSPGRIRHVVTDGYKVHYEKVTEAEQDAAAARAKKNGTYVEEPDVPNPAASRAGVDYDVVHNDVIEVVGPHGRVDRVFDDAADVPEPELLAAVRAAAGQG